MIGFKQTIAVTFLATGIGFTGSAQASLYDRGNGLVYDDILNITITNGRKSVSDSGDQRY
jgi:hypothetical protein